MTDSLFNPSRMVEPLKEQDLVPGFFSKNLTVNRAEYSPQKNTITTTSKDKNTLTHEMSHAVQSNLLEATASYLGNKKELSAKESQFLKAYNKITGKRIGGKKYFVTSEEKEIKERQKDFTQSLFFDRLDEETKSFLNKPLSKDKYIRDIQEQYRRWYKYRTTPDELQGWGVGFTSTLEQDKNVPSHVNPTMASEFDILLTMYEGLPTTIKKEAGVQRKREIEDFDFSNIEEDPFSNPFL